MLFYSWDPIFLHYTNSIYKQSSISHWGSKSRRSLKVLCVDLPDNIWWQATDSDYSNELTKKTRFLTLTSVSIISILTKNSHDITKLHVLHHNSLTKVKLGSSVSCKFWCIPCPCVPGYELHRHWVWIMQPSLQAGNITQPLTHRGWDKMADILQKTFWNAFSWMTIIHFNSNFTETCSHGTNFQYASIGSD